MSDDLNHLPPEGSDMTAIISQETSAKIWNAHSEIKNAKKLIQDMEMAIKSGIGPNPRDAFGRRLCLQLGVPSGDSGHRLFDVHRELALSFLRAHIAEQQDVLVEASEEALIEMTNARRAEA